MDKTGVITREMKVSLMPEVVFLLNTVLFTAQTGITMSLVKRMADKNDEFLKDCCMLIVSGYEPYLVEYTLNNFVNKEQDAFTYLKRCIQKDALLALQRSNPIYMASIIILSHFGHDFKSDYINLIRKYDINLYNILFKDDDFIFLSLKEMERNLSMQ